MVVFWKMRKYLGKVIVFGQKWLNLGKSGCIRVKMVLFEKTWLYFGKVDVFGQK